MLLKTNNLKFINNLKHIIILLISLMGVHSIYAQEVISDEVVKPETVKKDLTNSQNAKKSRQCCSRSR